MTTKKTGLSFLGGREQTLNSIDQVERLRLRLRLRQKTEDRRQKTEAFEV